MSIKTSKHQPSADIGTELKPLKGDAKDSIESQVNNLDSLHDHEADQARKPGKLVRRSQHQQPARGHSQRRGIASASRERTPRPALCWPFETLRQIVEW
jgi:hypothetical protein